MATIGRLVAIVEASTADFEVKMDAAARAMDKMTRTQVVATRAAGQVRTSLQTLSNQAFASIGPVGQFTTALTTLVGGTSALVATGVAGGLFLWFQHITKDLADATEKSEKLSAQWRRMAAERIGSPLLLQMAELEPFQLSRDEVQTQFDARLLRLERNEPGIPLAQRLIEDPKLAMLHSQLTSLNGIIEEIKQKPAKIVADLRREVELLGAPMEVMLASQARLKGLTGELAEEFIQLNLQISIFNDGLRIAAEIAKFDPSGLGRIGMFTPPPRMVRMEQFGGGPLPDIPAGTPDVSRRAALFESLRQQEAQRNEVLAVYNDKALMAQLATVGLADEIERMVLSFNKAEIKSQHLAVAIVTAVSSAVQAFISGGGAGSFLSAGGGIVSTLATKNPALLVPGVILSSLGGIVSALEGQASERERNEERRHRELIGELREGPARITRIFESADPDVALYEDGRQQRLGGTPRNGGL